MGTKAQKTKEYINKEFDCKACEYFGACKYGQGADSAELCDCDAERIAETYEAGWKAAMEYLYRRPLDIIVEDVIKEVKGE